eukprot:TRINITY_DN7409_c0_g1_i1.p1 TRINITY_DN7409_c0_g1~~TRINITY_DN7409_c0_g1_i1.p1  ORF type:complete len:238 (+),score=65.70 TRINITY_DN7409_c0_g1_i1:848-1561(+)
MVHSGSRGLGTQVLEEHKAKYAYRGFVEDTEEAIQYLEKHDNAMNWARCNRSLIAHRFLSMLIGSEVQPECGDNETTSDGSTRVLDIFHNYLSKWTFIDENGEDIDLWLHRKGAAPSNCGPVVIPGSRGAFSYLVEPIAEEQIQQTSAASLAHGAGRRWTRLKAKKAGQRMNKENLKTTDLGSKVICEKTELLYEEMPEAYKNIQAVIDDLVNFNLVKVIAVLRPLITYKNRVRVYE